MIPLVVVVGDEAFDLLFEFPGQVVFLEIDLVLPRPVIPSRRDPLGARSFPASSDEKVHRGSESFLSRPGSAPVLRTPTPVRYPTVTEDGV